MHVDQIWPINPSAARFDCAVPGGKRRRIRSLVARAFVWIFKRFDGLAVFLSHVYVRASEGCTPHISGYLRQGCPIVKRFLVPIREQGLCGCIEPQK